MPIRDNEPDLGLDGDLTIANAQARHKISRAQVYNLIARGQLSAYRIGKRGLRITRDSSDALRASGLAA